MDGKNQRKYERQNQTGARVIDHRTRIGKDYYEEKKLDGISNFWWKTQRWTWKKLAAVMQAWIEDPNKVPKWLTLVKRVLIPKAEDLSSEKD